MENNKKDKPDYHFHNNRANEKEASQENNEKSQDYEPQVEQENSYYYSYGPYRSQSYSPASGNQEEGRNQEPQRVEQVDITVPRTVKTVPSIPNQVNSEHRHTGSWQFEPKKKKRSSAFSIFAAFMAGAIIVGSLMFASDQMNLFTGSQSGSNSQSALPSLLQSNNSGVRTTSLEVTGSNTIAKIAAEANPAVVLIDAYAKPRSNSRSGSSFFDDPFFRQFFGDSYQSPQQSPQGQEELRKTGAGSGFIYRDSGYILTNQHVIDGADEVKVTIEGHAKQYTAKVLGSSYEYDLAVLKIEGDKPFPYLNLGNSDELNVGDWLVAIGNPFGFTHTVTVGVLSAKERPIDIPDRNGQREYRHLLQTDASINPGNSGGPLINLDGEVIGINTAISAQAQGIGFAIPMTTVFELLEYLESGKEVPKEPAPYIGVRASDIDADWVEELKLSNTQGAFIGEVQRGAPAFRGGIRQYDVVIQINDVKITNAEELVSTVQSLKVDENATFTIIRDGKQLEVTVKIGDKNEFENG